MPILFLRIFFLMGFIVSGGPTVTLYADSPLVALSTLEQQVHDLVNEHRSSLGLPPLSYDEEIAEIARQHSRDMANGYVGMSHEGAEVRQGDLARVMTFREFAENVAANSDDPTTTARTAVDGWLQSSGHRTNIEGGFDLTGVGIGRSGNTFFFTQIFLATGRRSVRAAPSVKPDRPQRRALVKESDERDPRKRPGRKRVPGGWVQKLEPDR